MVCHHFVEIVATAINNILQQQVVVVVCHHGVGVDAAADEHNFTVPGAVKVASASTAVVALRYIMIFSLLQLMFFFFFVLVVVLLLRLVRFSFK